MYFSDGGIVPRSCVYGEPSQRHAKDLFSAKANIIVQESYLCSDVRSRLSSRCNVPKDNVFIVSMAEGMIFPDERDLRSLKQPIKFMITNPRRKMPEYLKTSDKDITSPFDPDEDDDPRIKMSCGHAISQENLALHVRHELMNLMADKIFCAEPNCKAEWVLQEVARKADMSEDERTFYEFKISMNYINKDNKETSTCPNCEQFCRRQQRGLAVRCITCSRKNEKHFDFCWQCKAPWVSGHECSKKDLEAWQRILNEAPLKELGYSNIMCPSKRMCPNKSCKHIIEHKEACKQMTCKQCKTDFCFSCLTICKNKTLQCSGYNLKCDVAPVQNVFE